MGGPPVRDEKGAGTGLGSRMFSPREWNVSYRGDTSRGARGSRSPTVRGAHPSKNAKGEADICGWAKKSTGSKFWTFRGEYRREKSRHSGRRHA